VTEIRIPPELSSPARTEPEAPAAAPGSSRAVRLYGERLAGNSAELYRALRAQFGRVAPVLLDGDVPAWLVLGYRELHLVTSNPQLFGRDSRRWNAWDQVPPDWPLMHYVAWSPAIVHTEGADHQRRAGALGDALDAIDRTGLASICEHVADQLVDEFAGQGEADLIADYCLQIPIRVIARLLGIPDVQTADFVRDISASVDSAGDAMAAHQRNAERIGQLVQARRQRPRPDVASRLLAHATGLSDEQATLDLLFVVLAGQQPTADWIGNTLRLMLIDDQFSLTLQGGRSSAGQALNEVLWKDTPMQNMIGRYATQDCELGGERIRRGDLLVLGLAAANLDPQVHPGSLADSGMNRAHMSFSHGEHGCPFPAPELAEIIARTAIEVLLDRLPDVELAVPADELRWHPSLWVRALFALPVRFSPVTHLASHAPG
jgi:cytochrome P450